MGQDPLIQVHDVSGLLPPTRLRLQLFNASEQIYHIATFSVPNVLSLRTIPQNGVVHAKYLMHYYLA